MSSAENATAIAEHLNVAHKSLSDARESLKEAQRLMRSEKFVGREKAAELDAINGGLKLASAALGAKYWQWEGYATARMEPR